MRVLGYSSTVHGASMCLVEDGRIVRAVNLERLTRSKFAMVAFASVREAVAAVMRDAGEEVQPFEAFEAFEAMLIHVSDERSLRAAGIDLVVRGADYLRPPSFIAEWPEALQRFYASPELRESESTFVRYLSDARLGHANVAHHLCHAYQAYLASPFEDAAILTVDGGGEGPSGADVCATLALGQSSRVTGIVETPSSLGGMYMTTTRHLGFLREQEGNTMALAAFGTDRLYRELAASVELRPDGTFVLPGRWDRALARFCPQRERGEPLTDTHKDIAFACQAITEDVLVHMARCVHARTGRHQLAMAGGVALNCVANSRILQETPFDELYVMPNAGDRGLAVGAALYGYHVLMGGKERHPIGHDYLGRPLVESEILRELRHAPDIDFRRSNDVAAECAGLLASGSIMGWVQGGAEFGPRALGHRSILADPRSSNSKERLDRDIKRREWFRPYAPSVLGHKAHEYFEMHGPSPYMLQAPRSRSLGMQRIPGAVHVDGTARVQTVDREVEPRFYGLIERFEQLTGVPVVLNTSFNGYGEPMVETTGDALRAFRTMGLDGLAIGDWLVSKKGARST